MLGKISSSSKSTVEGKRNLIPEAHYEAFFVCLLLLVCIFFFLIGLILVLLFLFFFIANAYFFNSSKHKDFCNLFAGSSVAILIVSLKLEASYVGIPLFG